MTDLHLREGDPPVACDLDRSVVERLVATGVVSAIPLGGQRWELRAARKVGVVRIGAVTVWIKPKITIARLLWLLGWSRRAVFEAPGPVAVEESEDLVTALAEAFCAQAERALQAGLLQGYREVEGSEAVLRGRLRASDQLRRRFGLPVPLLVRYDDHLVDISENQILKAAATRLSTLPGIGASVRVRLRNLRGRLVDASDLAVPSSLPRWHPSRLNARYHDALWLAEIVLMNGSIEHEPGRLRLDGFLVDLYQVFESFVTSSLGLALERRGGRCHPQDRFTLDEEGQIDIRPDLVWRIEGRPAAVIDAKYKAEKPAGFPQADLYQALAYASAYQLDEAHLVYAKGNETAQRWTVRNAGVQITAHALDLDQLPAQILDQVGTLARRIDQLASRSAPLTRAAERMLSR
jgi:5-methylcytosine-specific restriction enzyme subunit McrC